MSEYINRENAIEELKAWATNLCNPTNLVREDAFYILETMEYIEIVRCKDCKYATKAYPYMCNKGKGLAIVEDGDCYCSYGERIEK